MELMIAARLFLFLNHRMAVRVTLPVTDNLNRTPVLRIDDNRSEQVYGHVLRIMSWDSDDADNLELSLLFYLKLVQHVLIHVDGVIFFYDLGIHDHEGKIAVFNAL